MPTPTGPTTRVAAVAGTPHTPPQDGMEGQRADGGSAQSEVSKRRHSHSALAALHNRVGRVLQDLGAGRTVADADLRQHALDCAFLMEQAHAMNTHIGREEAVLWMHRQAEAMRSLSPQWKAAREASAGDFLNFDGALDRARVEGHLG